VSSKSSINAILLTISLVSVCTTLLSQISVTTTYLYLLTVIGLTLGAPIGMINVMKYKK
jgi:hypothetical protein